MAPKERGQTVRDKFNFVSNLLRRKDQFIVAFLPGFTALVEHVTFEPPLRLAGDQKAREGKGETLLRVAHLGFWLGGNSMVVMWWLGGAVFNIGISLVNRLRGAALKY